MHQHDMAQPDIAVEAIEALLSGRVSGAVAMALAQGCYGTASQKLMASLTSNFLTPKISNAFASIGEAFPRSVMSRDPLLAAYRKKYRSIPGLMQKKVGIEASEWASYAMVENPEMVMDLCETEPAKRYISYGIDGMLGVPVEAGTKKKDKSREKFYSKLESSTPLIRREIYASGAEHDMDAAVLIAANHLMGGFGPIIHYSLACQYTYYVSYIMLVSAGMGCESLDGFRKSCDLENVEFCEDVLMASEVLAEFQAEGSAVAIGGPDVAYSFSESVREHLDVSAKLARFLEEEAAQNLKQAKLSGKREADLSRELSSARSTIERLRAASTNEELSSAHNECAALRRELSKLTNELALRDQRIASLEAKLAQRGRAVREVPEASSAIRQEARQVETAQTNKADMSYLGKLKVLVVGGHLIFHQKVRKVFPEWLFYDADEATVGEAAIAAADLIIFHTNYCSHKLTDGVLNKARLLKKPLGYAYKVNLPAFFAEVEGVARKEVAAGA
ncbi:hypothetical protein [Azonexus hydrophilus]|uniref:DUF2325 domain-containing protein n=1 Tax=Azonexus hydrophilus TaxID=418702 RepID=A0ABZ2XLE0_9RHOO